VGGDDAKEIDAVSIVHNRVNKIPLCTVTTG
jgi:hypothetical protein